jgi:hypothetical protein
VSEGKNFANKARVNAEIWKRALPEKLLVSQLVKKVNVLWGLGRYIPGLQAERVSHMESCYEYAE